MGNYNQEYDVGRDGGGGWMGGGGVGIVLILLILFGLFGRGHLFGGGGEGHGYRGEYKDRTWFPDIGNWELETHLDRQFCKTNELTIAQATKTNDLITGNIIQELRDKNLEKDMTINTMRSEMFTANLVGGINRRLDMIQCEMLKRPPVFGQAAIPCNASTVTGCGEPRRGECGF